MNILRTAFNSLAPNCLYRPAFGQNAELVLNGQDGNLVDVPRFDGDTLLSARAGSHFLVKTLASGEYSSNKPQAEFEHRAFAGVSHYELQAVAPDSFYDNYLEKPTTPNSRFLIAARNADTLFTAAQITARTSRAA